MNQVREFVPVMQMTLDKGIPVHFGHVQGMVFGGPFKNFVPKTRRLVSVKMAAEISHVHDISIPTEDFSIPDSRDMESGMVAALTALFHGNDIYAGCMGGIGRTGLFMGCMAKLMQDMGEIESDPVNYVRQYYKPHAIETAEQQDFVRTFDTTYLQEFVTALLTPKVRVEQRVMTPWEWWVSFWK